MMLQPCNSHYMGQPVQPASLIQFCCRLRLRAKFYCPHALADNNCSVHIREKISSQRISSLYQIKRSTQITCFVSKCKAQYDIFSAKFYTLFIFNALLPIPKVNSSPNFINTDLWLLNIVVNIQKRTTNYWTKAFWRHHKKELKTKCPDVRILTASTTFWQFNNRFQRRRFANQMWQIVVNSRNAHITISYWHIEKHILSSFRQQNTSRFCSTMTSFTTKQLADINKSTVYHRYTPCTIKKDPWHFSYNSSKNCPIPIIFGRYINKRLGNHKIVYFPTSPK